MVKQKWGRRRSDNQPYPKTEGKEVLPSGLAVVQGTQRVEQSYPTCGVCGGIVNRFGICNKCGMDYRVPQEVVEVTEEVEVEEEVGGPFTTPPFSGEGNPLLKEKK